MDDRYYRVRNSSREIYLSPIVDCFGDLISAWKIGTFSNADLMNSMLEDAILRLTTNECPLIHTDCGCHYHWLEWIKGMDAVG